MFERLTDGVVELGKVTVDPLILLDGNNRVYGKSSVFGSSIARCFPQIARTEDSTYWTVGQSINYPSCNRLSFHGRSRNVLRCINPFPPRPHDTRGTLTEGKWKRPTLYFYRNRSILKRIALPVGIIVKDQFSFKPIEEFPPKFKKTESCTVIWLCIENTPSLYV